MPTVGDAVFKGAIPLVIHFDFGGFVSAKARLDSWTIRWSSFNSASFSSGFWASLRRLEVAKNSSCSSLNRLVLLMDRPFLVPLFGKPWLAPFLLGQLTSES